MTDGIDVRGALGALAASARSDFIEAVELDEVPIPAQFAIMRGAFRGVEMELVTRRYRGERLRSVTLALMYGGPSRDLISVTLSACPEPGWALPVLGVDYVCLRKRLSLAVCDLAPLVREDWERDARPLIRQTREAFEAHGLPQRRRPAFVDETFSPLAVFGAARAGQEAIACGEAVVLIGRYVALLERARARAPEHIDQAERAMRRWCEAMKHNKKEARALNGIFGALAHDYLEGFLFEV